MAVKGKMMFFMTVFFGLPWCLFGKTVILPDENKQELGLRQCIAKAYQEGPTMDFESQTQLFCVGVQDYIDCFVSVGAEGDEMEKINFLALQEAVVFKVLRICPDLQLKMLKNLVEKSEIGRKLEERYNIEKDEYKHCAAIAIRKCMNEAVNAWNQNQQEYKEVDKMLVKCYEEEGKNEGCNAPILADFAKMWKEVGEDYIKEEQNLLPDKE